MQPTCNVCNKGLNKAGQCKACYLRQWRAANKDYVRERAKQKRDSPEAREKQRAYMEVWRAQNADVIAAKALAHREKNRTAARDFARQWRIENNAKSRVSSAAYRAANLEQAKATVRAWRARNKAVSSASSKRWRAAHPDERRRYENKRRDKARGTLSKGLVLKLYLAQAGACACCGAPLGSKFHLDHIVPLKLGGTTTDANMQLLTPRCNAQKGAAPYDVYLARKQKELEATLLQSVDSQ